MKCENSFIDEYNLLVELVNNNLNTSKRKSVIFELPSSLSENIFDFPVQNLLAIDDYSLFIHESYYKILDRSVDYPGYQHFFTSLNNQEISKADFISILTNSAERRIKKTSLKHTFSEAKI